jgi:hypothetical protein
LLLSKENKDHNCNDEKEGNKNDNYDNYKVNNENLESNKNIILL